MDKTKTKTQDPYVCWLKETHFRPKDTHRLKVRGWERVVPANGNKKKSWVAILISDEINFQTKTVIRDKEGHNMIKGSLQQQDITI